MPQKDKRSRIHRLMDKINPATITINCSEDFRRKFIFECRERNVSINSACIAALKKWAGWQEYKPKKDLISKQENG